ncbi:hypothetical protein [Streptomyces sp. NPDC048659]|uniref:hypothetical protein n=1 Tax=Streptomyces sp. NPDC048659 TaxID=3155489 RepID=UPI003412ACD1
MRDLVADLVLPAGASMYVMSALETSRELIRHSSYRYEFATVAVPHALFAVEQVLAERLAPAEPLPLRVLIERAVGAGLVTPRLAAELDHGRLLRDRLAQGAASSAALHPLRAVELVRAVFDAVALLLLPPAGSGGGLDRLWAAHLDAPFPGGFRGVDIGGVDLVLLDADVAGLVQTAMSGGFDGDGDGEGEGDEGADRDGYGYGCGYGCGYGGGVARLWGRIADLDRVLPLLNEEYCVSYFTRLRAMAQIAAAPHVPSAT